MSTRASKQATEKLAGLGSRLQAMAALGAAGSGLWRSVVQVSGVATELIGMQATKGKVQAVGRAVKPDVEKGTSCT